MSEAERDEKQTTEPVERASAFEMSIMLLLIKKIKDVLKTGTKRAKSEAINEIRKQVSSETKKFLNDEKKLVSTALEKVGYDAYEEIDERSFKKIKPKALLPKYEKEVNDNFKKYMKSKGTNYALNRDTNIYQFFNIFIEKNVSDVVDGKVPIEDAIADAINTLSKTGIKLIDYKSGITRNVDVYVRQQMLYAAKESTQELREENAKEDGITIWEFDAHPNARPSHQVWQGKRYDTTGKYYPTLDELTHGEHKDYGCKHRAFPVYNRKDKPMYTKKQLKNINTEPFVWNGKKYDGYEATQEMRKQERKIRELKRCLNLQAENDIDTTETNYKLKKADKEYTSFCKAFGTYRRNNRLNIA